MNTGFYDEDGNEVWCMEEKEHRLYKVIGVVCPCIRVLYHMCDVCGNRAKEYVGRADSHWCDSCKKWDDSCKYR